MRVLIVDDEPVARQGLRRELARLPGVVCTGECGGRDEAVAAIVDQQPDVVLLDIQLGRHSAFEIIEQIGVEEMPLVIFVTAYDRHAIRAFEVNALDYVLKPVDPIRLGEAMDRANRAMAAEDRATVPGRKRALEAGRAALPLGEPEPLERIVVRDGERLTFVEVDAIDWIEARGNYVGVHVGARTYTARTTMDRIGRRLAGAGQAGGPRFVRIRRSALVNARAIRTVSRYSKGMFQLELRGGAKIVSSRYHQAALRELLGREGRD
jgi:two-component system, LytTR family, response regulator